MRAVNQAIGRVIRHRNDYGAVLLADERFASVSLQQQLSLWLRPLVQAPSDVGPVLQSLTAFFRENGSAGSFAMTLKLEKPVGRLQHVSCAPSTYCPLGGLVGVPGALRFFDRMDLFLRLKTSTAQV
jgi:regulator of telomere elongation helicase 1